MPERTLDQVIAHYQAAGQQVTLPTPVPPPTIVPRIAERPAYVVPNAFQSTYAPGMGRTIEHYMSRGTAMGVPAQMAPPVTPQPTMMMSPIPMAGLTANPVFHDPFQAMARRQLGGLATTTAAVNRRWVAQTGQRWGGRVGAGVGAIGGAMIGGFSGAIEGASLGEMIGGWIGNIANDVPLLGNIMRGYNRLRWGGAMEQLAATNRLRQRLFGKVQLVGGQADMLTGTGIGVASALQLSQRFGRANIPGMNRNDLINLAGAAAETGFLDNATNVKQIARTVKSIANLMGEIARLTGDPNFRNNLRRLASLRNAGMNMPTALEFLRSAPLFARMAGGAVNAQTGAGVGAELFHQVGLTPGLGMHVGAETAGLVHRGMGGITPIQRGLWGGEEGIKRAMIGMQAQFMGRTAKLLLPYLVQRNESGQLSINQERLRAFRSGRVGFQEMVSRGVANLGSLGIGSMQDLLQQAPELQTRLAQQLGPWGGFVTMANMARNLQQQYPGMTLGNAAAQVAGGTQQGRMLQQFMTNPQMVQRMIKDITVRQRQLRLQGRRTALAAQEKELGWFERWNEENREELRRGAARLPELRRRMLRVGLIKDEGKQQLEAFDRMREQAAAEAERTGLRRIVHPPGARISRREEELAKKRMTEGWSKLLSRIENPATGMAPGELSEAQIQAVARWHGGKIFWLNRLLEPGLVKHYRQKALEHIRTLGTRIGETRKITEEQFRIGERHLRKTMEEQFGDNFHRILAAIKTKIVQYAHNLGHTDRGGLRMDVIRAIIKKVLIENGLSRRNAERWMAKNGAAMERWAIRWIDQSGDKDALRALQRTESAFGLAKNAFSAEASEDRARELTEGLNKTYFEVGLASSESAPTPEEEAGISALYEEEDPTVRMAAMLMGKTHLGTPEEQQALEEKLSRLRSTMGEKRWRRAEKLFQKLTPGQREALRFRIGGRIARGETTIEEEAKDFERSIRGRRGSRHPLLGMRTSLAELQRRRRKAGTEGEEIEVGAGAGLRTTETEKRVAGLEEQKKMLEDMARNMNQAAKSLQKTSAAFAEVVLRAGVPKH